MSSKNISAAGETLVASEQAEKIAVKDSSTSEKKYGFVRFLQLNPQKSGITSILRSRYASEVHTLAEWNSIVENVLNRKVK